MPKRPVRALTSAARAPTILALAMLALAILAPTILAGTAPAFAFEADATCDPEIHEALTASAMTGVEQDLVIIRDPDYGIRDPESILDLSCIEDLFDFKSFDIFFNPMDIVDMLKQRICRAARDAHAKYIGRPLSPSVYFSGLERLPGVDIRNRSTPDEPRIIIDPPAGGSAERFRRFLEGS